MLGLIIVLSVLCGGSLICLAFALGKLRKQNGVPGTNLDAQITDDKFNKEDGDNWIGEDDELSRRQEELNACNQLLTDKLIELNQLTDQVSQLKGSFDAISRLVDEKNSSLGAVTGFIVEKEKLLADLEADLNAQNERLLALKDEVASYLDRRTSVLMDLDEALHTINAAVKLNGEGEEGPRG